MLRSSVLLLLVLALATPAAASVVVPIPEATLAHHAAAIVKGRVVAIQSHWDLQAQQIFTYITVAVDEVLKGRAPVRTLTIKQVGGRIADVEAWVDGSPEFTVGERVLLFLRANRDGTLHVAHLYQGKFSIETDPWTGDQLAYRPVPRGVHAIQAPGIGGAVPGHDLLPLRDLETRLRQILARRATTPVTPEAALDQASAPQPDSTLTEVHAQFTFLGTPARWFEPDTGQAVSMRINSTGEPLAPTGGQDEILDAFQAWSGVSGSSFRYQNDGSTSAYGFRADGVNAISFRDPLGQIDNPVNCGGILATGGYYRTGESRVVNGQSFSRIVEGDVVVNDGWQGCGFYENYKNFAEVMAHELGHVLGLGHSADSHALMYATAHFDGRGAALGADDVAGLVFIYPAPVASTYTLQVSRTGSGTGTVTSSPDGVTCDTTCAGQYPAGTLVTLTAVPSADSTFAGWSGACTGTGTCTLTLGSNVTLTATFDLTTPLRTTLTAVHPLVRVGKSILVQMTVTNLGTQGTTVTLATPTAQGTGTVGPALGAASPAAVPAGQSVGFTWRYRATGAGEVRFTGLATSPLGNSLPATSDPVTMK